MKSLLGGWDVRKFTLTSKEAMRARAMPISGDLSRQRLTDCPARVLSKTEKFPDRQQRRAVGSRSRRTESPLPLPCCWKAPPSGSSGRCRAAPHTIPDRTSWPEDPDLSKKVGGRRVFHLSPVREHIESQSDPLRAREAKPSDPLLQLLNRKVMEILHDDCWRGVGDVVTGMNRQSYWLHLSNIDAGTWRDDVLARVHDFR